MFWRVQPRGLPLWGHRSGLAYEKVDGVFAFEDPSQLFETYTWIHVRRELDSYEMVAFDGTVIARPDDSEGIVVRPSVERARVPLREWLDAYRLGSAVPRVPPRT